MEVIVFPSNPSAIPFLGVRHAAVATADLNQAIEFYRKYLGFGVYHVGDADWAMLQLGDTSLSLVRVEGYRAPEVANEPRGANYAHIGIVVGNRTAVDEVRAGLSKTGVKLSRTKEHRDGSYGFYFHDLDGNDLECIFIPHRSHASAPLDEAWIVLAHGSSDNQWAAPFHRLVERLKSHVPGQTCRLAFLERAQPDFSTSVNQLLEEKSFTQIRVFPVFLSNGGVHMKRDVPALVDAARAKHPGVTFRLEPALGEHLLVEEAIAVAMVRSAEERKTHPR